LILAAELGGGKVFPSDRRAVEAKESAALEDPVDGGVGDAQIIRLLPIDSKQQIFRNHQGSGRRAGTRRRNKTQEQDAATRRRNKELLSLDLREGGLGRVGGGG
jgi:hypothetical protein